MTQETKETYEYIGTYPNSDARVLLDAFEKRGIRFDINVDAAQLKGMTPCKPDSAGSSDKDLDWPSRCILMMWKMQFESDKAFSRSWSEQDPEPSVAGYRRPGVA